jgi:hypothetical protein
LQSGSGRRWSHGLCFRRAGEEAGRGCDP